MKLCRTTPPQYSFGNAARLDVVGAKQSRVKPFKADGRRSMSVPFLVPSRRLGLPSHPKPCCRSQRHQERERVAWRFRGASGLVGFKNAVAGTSLAKSVHTHIHTCIHTDLHVYTHTCIHIYIYIHIYRYTHIGVQKYMPEDKSQHTH